MSRKACKKCKIFVEGSECPICKSSDFVTNWKGRVYVIDSERSEIAKKIGHSMNGEYAIKVR